MRNWEIIVISALTWWLAGCGGSSGGTPAPSGLSYSSAQHIVIGSAVSLTPTVTGQISAYSISPALQDGLSLNQTTGVISGTPTAVLDSTNYTVTASNAGGSTTATLAIQVRDTNVQFTYAASPSNGDQITVVASSYYGIASVSASVLDKSLGTLTVPNISRTYVFTLTGTYVSGTYPVTITTTTDTGVTETYSGSITVSNPPVLTVSPKFGAIASGTLTISGTVASDKPGAVGVEISLNGAVIYTGLTQNTYSVTYNLSDVPPGFATISVFAQDATGGQSFADSGIVVTSYPSEASLVPLVYANAILAVDGANYLYDGFDGKIHLDSSAGDVVLQGATTVGTGLKWLLSAGLPYGAGAVSGDQNGTSEGSDVYTWPANGSAPVNLSALAGDTSQSDTLLSVHDNRVLWVENQSVDLFNLVTQKLTTFLPAQGESFEYGSYSSSGDFFLTNNELQVYFPGSLADTDEVFQWKQATNAVTTVPGSAGGQFVQTDGTVVAWDSNSVPSNLVVFDIASATTTVLTTSELGANFYLAGGILAWADGMPGVNSQIKVYSEESGATAVASTDPSSQLLAAGGGYVIFQDALGLEAWNSLSGTTTLVIQSAAKVYISGKTLYFGPINDAPLSALYSGGYWYREVLP